ncbi:MAG: redox-regulated ATPase YchF [Flavobacteriales bacterium]|nr:redox-regulated ATPase YchF [Flavobacteriales bacterium]
MKCGIVGLPNVGKSTLFNCLSNAKATAANFPFCTIEPNVGVVIVPDPRMDVLINLVKPQNTVPATVEFVDIAGLVKGASKGEGLGNQFLGNIRETDLIIHVLRCFDNDNVVHVDGGVNPVRDKEVIDAELQLKDLDTVDKRLDRARKNAKSGDKEAVKVVVVLEAYKSHLEAGKSARSVALSKEEIALVPDLHLLTAKPVLYVCNVDEGSVQTGNAHVESVKQAVKEEDAEVVIVAAAIEEEIASLEDPEDRKAFLEEMGLKEPGINMLIRAAYRLLNLITYFTAGEKEVRAWTVMRGARAPQAAGVIHSDFEKGFIRAEVIKYDDFSRLGSELACKEAGKLAVEGKEYVVEDGDIMHFRFNV